MMLEVGLLTLLTHTEPLKSLVVNEYCIFNKILLCYFMFLSRHIAFKRVDN